MRQSQVSGKLKGEINRGEGAGKRPRQIPGEGRSGDSAEKLTPEALDTVRKLASEVWDSEEKGLAPAAAHGTGEPDLGRLIDEYGTGLLRMCFLYLKDRQLAEDAVQEAYIRAYGGWNGFRGQCSEKTWIVGIAMNVCRSMLRSPWHRRVFCSEKPLLEASNLQFASETTGAGAKGEPEALLKDDTVLREIAALRPKYREVILLFYYQEMKTKEIAALLGISESNVCVRLNRAREQLRSSLKGWYLHE